MIIRLKKRSRVAVLGCGLLVLTGCSGRPARVDQPDYAAGAGSAAVHAYDKDGDKAIAGAELDGVPGIRDSLAQVDADGDSRLTAQGIDARIQAWRDSRVALLNVPCQVTLDGEPLKGAQVAFEPESFLGPGVKPGGATTGAGGAAAVSMAAEHLPDPNYSGMACGWYKIKVTSDGRQIPARYNTQTTLGCEVAPNAGWMYEPGEIVLELTSQ